MMRFCRILLFLTFLGSLIACRPTGETVSVTFVVESDSLPQQTRVYLSGNQAALGRWHPSMVPLAPAGASRWEKRMEFPVGTRLEYKFTLGDWRREALQSNGLEFPNLEAVVRRDTTLFLKVRSWEKPRGTLRLSRERLANKAGMVETQIPWFYHGGDDPQWANPAFPDSTWQQVSTPLRPQEMDSLDWSGIAWFRLHLDVDSLLWGNPVTLTMVQAGASEVYLNGKRVLAFGEVSKVPETEKRFLDRTPVVVRVDSLASQVLAVRYSNHTALGNRAQNWVGGFMLEFGDPAVSIPRHVANTRHNTFMQAITTIFPLTLALVHLVLFAFSPSIRANVYYAICLLGFAGLGFASYQGFFETDFGRIMFFNKLFFISITTTMVFGAYTLYAENQDRLPKMAWVIAGLAFLLVAWFFFLPRHFSFSYAYAVMGVVGIEMVRQIYTMVRSGRGASWFSGLGLLALVVAIGWQELIDNNIVPAPGGQRVIYIYGLMSLALTMTVNLAREVSGTRKRLVAKLEEARDMEIERRLLELDNQRKTAELEEARQIQLALLPTSLPELTDFRLAARMQTATEVGGDYYDFIPTTDGGLIAVVGDATGHGMRAGIMVTLIKTLLPEVATTFFLPDFFQKCTRVIKSLKLRNLFMGLTLVRLNGERFTASAAGMPSLLIFRRESGEVEELVLKGMPLGGPFFKGYREVRGVLAKGDVMVLRSDGLDESFNPDLEELGDEALKDCLRENGHRSPEEILNAMVRLGENWRGQKGAADDITLVVIKKETLPPNILNS
ncbi:MAG TPA: SpoIIE family protein phosphatase [Calditrichia bacterium]|nr:SpoIIE family protein phosphatase [Calditrichota bacterium]HQV30459.1 SpoIIE family protein phosphatase [Calditrichia bacterium]